MGLLNRLIKKEHLNIQSEPDVIYAPVSGKYIPLEQIPDEMFSQGVLGQGCGIEPADSKLYAPVDGTVSVVAHTKHAIGINCKNGEEYLLHIGLDTVDLKGRGFQVKVQQGDAVKAGQLLMVFDKEEIQKKYCITSGFVVTNAEDYPGLQIETGKTYMAGEAIGRIR